MSKYFLFVEYIIFSFIRNWPPCGHFILTVNCPVLLIPSLSFVMRCCNSGWSVLFMVLFCSEVKSKQSASYTVFCQLSVLHVTARAHKHNDSILS